MVDKSTCVKHAKNCDHAHFTRHVRAQLWACWEKLAGEVHEHLTVIPRSHAHNYTLYYTIIILYCRENVANYTEY